MAAAAFTLPTADLAVLADFFRSPGKHNLRAYVVAGSNVIKWAAETFLPDEGSNIPDNPLIGFVPTTDEEKAKFIEAHSKPLVAGDFPWSMLIQLAMEALRRLLEKA